MNLTLITRILALAIAASAAVASAQFLPDDAYTAELYSSSCIACHSSAISGAPLAGDAAAWAPRLEQGLDILLDHTIDGIRGMPPLGSCADCTAEDFEALILFMAGDTAEGQN